MGLYVILMGVQGAGKGEQAKFIRETYNIPHISTGDLFRAMKTREDDLAKRVQQIMAEGRLVDDATTNEVLQDRLSQPDAANGVILDGYPRNAAQADWLESYLESRGEHVNIVLLLQLDLYTAFKRAFGRVSHPDGSKSYNVYFNSEGVEWQFVDHPEKLFPPRLKAVETATGTELVRRADDGSAHAILKRIDTYVETTQPLIDYYRAKGLLVEIDADQPIPVVSEALKAAIDAAQPAN
ncbi:MAG: nucleoside monophosphate kinase [Anaerolineae bacterium]|nr:nucleoside monophosphate kinase [Anaerolineae bacterium]